jgi:glutamate carboxypeptidase
VTTDLPAIAVEEARRVHAAAAAEIDLVLASLETWVNIDTPSLDIEALDGFASSLASTLEDFGLDSELVVAGESGVYLHAALEGGGRAQVCLLCHHDTVFPRGTAHARPFRREGNRVLGPGVADMKGGIAVAAHAARVLALGPRPFARLELVSAPDEEPRTIGPATLERLAGFDAVLSLECGRPDHSVVSARKGARWIRLQATGRPAHAGVEPDAGRNAVAALCREALRLGTLHRARPGLTLQVTELHGGEGKNTVPAKAMLTADLRATTVAALDWAVDEAAKVGTYDGVEIVVEDLGGPPVYERTPAVAALADAAIALGALLGDSFGETTTGGVSDGSWTAGGGIPTLDGLGPAGGLDHTPDEYAEVSTFASRCGVVAGLIAAVDSGLLETLAVQEPTS